MDEKYLMLNDNFLFISVVTYKAFLVKFDFNMRLIRENVLHA